MFTPRLDTLPTPQQRLWPELDATPAAFTLYGGTAIALRLGHRQSVDFDFFSTEPFIPRALLTGLPFLRGAALLQSAANTLTCLADRGGPVRISFFGGLRIGQVAPHEKAAGGALSIASLIDLAGLKAAVVTQRAEAKDYLDLHALLTIGGLDLASMLAAASILYGETFSPLLSLKAIAYHEDTPLAKLPESLRRDLIRAARATSPHKLPSLPGVRSWAG